MNPRRASAVGTTEKEDNRASAGDGEAGSRGKERGAEGGIQDGGAGGDLLKNGVVKHSTHIVSRLFTLRAYLRSVAPARAPRRALVGFFQPFPGGIFQAGTSIFNFREIFRPPGPPPCAATLCQRSRNCTARMRGGSGNAKRFAFVRARRRPAPREPSPRCFLRS